METDYEKIIAGIEKTIAEKFKQHDSMRWPFMAGALQSELRAMCNLVKIQRDHIKEVQSITQFINKH